MDKKVFYIILLIVVAAVVAFLVSRPVVIEEAKESTIYGSWQSVDDAKFIRQFNEDGTLVDLYNEEVVDQGTWQPFTKNNSVATDYPLEANTIYIQIVGKDGTRQMKVAAVTLTNLELMYLGGNQVLHFTRPQ